MKQQIRYRGLTLNTDEQAAQPGELALCGNTELHDGALRPSFLSGTDVAAGADFPGTLLYIHKTASYTHYIGYGNNSVQNQLFYRVEGSSSYTTTWFPSSSNVPTAQGIIDINSVGNTLIINYGSGAASGVAQGTHYFLFKNSNYVYLGQRPPFPQLQFMLHFEPVGANENDPNSEEYYFSHSGICWDSENNNISIKDEYRSSVTEYMMGIINKRISSLTEQGYFYAPFLLRYCYRMFDAGGSMAWHSAPVLMYPMLQHPMTAILKDSGIVTNTSFFHCYLYTQRVKLHWRCVNALQINGLGDWADVVKSVDIFITPQFSRIDTAGLIKETIPIPPDYPGEGFVDEKYYLYLNGRISSTYNTNAKGVFELPEQEESEFFKRIKNSSEFFKLASINTDGNNFSANFSELTFAPDILENIAVQERMKDDYHSNYNVQASGSFTYNSRLHLYGISETIRTMQPFALLFPYCSRDDDDDPEGEYDKIANAKVVLKTEDGTKQVALPEDSTSWISKDALTHAFLFFPDSRASSFEIQLNNAETNDHGVFNMETSSLLECAVSLRNGVFDNESYVAPSSNADTVPYPNKIYVSEVSNPYFFPLSGRQTVGIGSIIGLTANTRALSEGQFGQFPLMVFCSDGIWTLEVNNMGTYSSASSVSREVCVNPASICQLDQSVLFASKKGLSRIVGSDVALVSEVLNGPVVNCGTLLGLNSVFGSGGTFQNSDVYKLMQATGSPLSFITSGQLLYDFANERVLVLPSSPTANTSNVVYVLSLRDGTWSTMLIPGLVKAINGYPHPYMQVWKRVESSVNKYKITCLDKPYDYTSNSIYSGIIVTRTLNFETAMKALQGFEQLHTIKPAGTGETKPQPVLWLYGSNDNITWKEIGHSDRLHYPYLAAHTYRFYRMALYLNMKPSERYHATVIDVIEKYNKL